MLQSALYPKTLKDAPKDEVSVNAKLLIQAGFLSKLMAGVYTYLPLGLMVLKKIENIIREEMLKAGAAELLMPALHPKENWLKTGRWDTLDVLFRTSSSTSNNEFALGPTHEEVITPLLARSSLSYKDLPINLFQIQHKFRDEKRAKSGLLRGKEFLMKDLYSFHKDEESSARYYEKMKIHYKNIFKVAGIGEKTYLTYASGGTFSKLSHEFQTITEAGEDVIFLCEKCGVAVNDEVKKDYPNCPECGNKNLRELKSIEVGNIFPLKTKFSVAFDLKFKNESGKEEYVVMGCYGIGLGRLLGAIVEVSHDDEGIIWPDSVSPFSVHLIELKGGKVEAGKLYKKLKATGIEVLYDEREDLSAGEKFSDADLIGIPHRVVVSEKTVKADKFEVKKRGGRKVSLLAEKELLAYVQKV